MMHPIEHLRHVARAGGDPALVAREAALALAEIAGSEPAGLVPGCRRLIERHLLSGPLWWLSARVLSAEDQAAAARQAAAELASDPTDRHVAASLPDEATVLVLGWPEITASALRRRGDVEALVVDSAGEGAALVRRLGAAGGEATLVPESGVGPATATSDLVVVEALAAGPTGVLAAPASLAAAAVALHSSVPVWAVTGVGRVLPSGLWDALLDRFDSLAEPWDRDGELVAAALIDSVVGPDGAVEVAEGLGRASCPVAPELLRSVG